MPSSYLQEWATRFVSRHRLIFKSWLNYSQVTNLSSCIKIAVDFVAPCNVMYSSKIGAELREHRLDIDDDEAEDVLNLPSMCWWYFVRSQTNVYGRARSVPASNPWVCPYSAAPRYLQVPVRSSARGHRSILNLVSHLHVL